jgi:RNA polymerase sigma-70 factor, ECF subfamily
MLVRPTISGEGMAAVFVNESMLTDALRRAQAGDEHGFTDLWRMLQPRLLRYLRIAIGGLAEDVAAETWLQVVRDLPGFHGDGSRFRAWLFAVARNRAIDQARRAGRRREDPTEIDDLTGIPDETDTETEAMTWLETERALALIATLPREQAEAVALRVIAGLTPRQAATVLGKRPGAIRVATMRGLNRLAERLAAETEPTAHFEIPDAVTVTARRRVRPTGTQARTEV